MDPGRWRRVREIFDEVVDLAPADRDARLIQACGDDPDLRREVESLLAHDRTAQDSIERLLVEAALEDEEGTAGRPPEMPAVIGRYRVLEKLGEGGMGEVYLAEDPSLGRRVAIKLPMAELSGDPDTRLQLQREARAAATLSHPHVCVVHEVGETPGRRPFIAMEYVEGETLAARIRRGRLPLDEVLEVGAQAAGALMEAHAKGVIHRDLKPSNIMLTAHGVKLLDFGLASVARETVAKRRDPGAALAGTIPYMSPEQARAEPVDHRTDLFSLGIVLYEAATGRLPFEGPTARAMREAIIRGPHVPPTAIADDLPVGFDRVIARALAKDRDERYRSADDLRTDLARLAAERRPRAATPPRTRRALVAMAALAAVALAASSWLAVRPPPSVAPEEGTVLIATFVNDTGDPAFDGTLEEALVLQIQQTPFLKVFPEAGVRETLRSMERSPDERLTEAVAREICRRRGIKTLIAGSVGRRNGRYAITLTARNARSGTALASERAEAAGRIHVLPALGTAAIQLRRRLGESAESIRTFSTPVEQATTGSLDALKAYALGLEQAGTGNYPLAVSLYQRAVQIDPEFALAWQALAREQDNTSYSELVRAAGTRAYDLRDRTTERERLRITAFYHLSVTGDLEKAIDAGERWKQTFPLDWQPYHALGDLYLAIAQYEKAFEAAREAVRLNPDVAAVYSNMAGALFALGRFAEARQVYERAMTRGLDAPEYHAYLWRIAYYAGDTTAMQRELDWAAASATWAFNMPALSAALQGRWREATRLSRRAIEFFERRGLNGLVALAVRYDAVNGALLGDCDSSRKSAALIVGSAQSIQEQARGLVALAVCGESGRALALADRLRERHPANTLVNQVWRPLVQAAAWLDRGQPARAAEALRAAAPYEGAADSWPVYMRGLALHRAGAFVEAQAAFQEVLDHRGRTFWYPFYPLAHAGLARAAARRGDAAAAARAYEAFFALWKEADQDLPVLVEARKEYERLRGRSPAQ
jgi:tetratricopeptide (TPR) repeat protein